MSKVIIRSNAFRDPRLVALGHIIRMEPSAVGWRLAFTWSWVQGKATPLMKLSLAAECMRRKADVVRTGLLRVGLAREHDAETLDLQPLTELFAESLLDEESDEMIAGKDD